LRQHEIWRIRYYVELYREYKNLDLVSSFKFKRLQWAGHVQRLPLDLTCKKAQRAEFIGSRPVARPRFKLEEGIKIFFHTFLVLILESDHAEQNSLEAEIMGD
jgi:hypothetical protein